MPGVSLLIGLVVVFLLIDLGDYIRKKYPSLPRNTWTTRLLKTMEFFAKVFLVLAFISSILHLPQGENGEKWLGEFWYYYYKGWAVPWFPVTCIILAFVLVINSRVINLIVGPEKE